MSTVKIKTQKELETFLRVLAEESVNIARAGMSRETEEQRQKSFASRIKADKAALSEEDPPTDADPAAAPKPEKPPAAPAPAPEPETTPGPEAPPAEINPSIGDLVDAIKDIRGGMGAGDSAIESELRTYFDRLGNPEQVSLVVMLRSIGEIMRQKIKGAEAKEPEQMNVITTMRSVEKSAEKKAPAAPETTASPSAKQASPEDTSPPIKVGEPVSEAYRLKIRDLLSRR